MSRSLVMRLAPLARSRFVVGSGVAGSCHRLERSGGLLDPAKRRLHTDDPMSQHMAGKVALEPEVASAKLFIALESTNEVAAIGGQLSLSGAGRGKVAEEELEREHDPSARRLVLHLVEPAAQR